MNVSSEHLRDEFKAHIEKWSAIQDKSLSKPIIAAIEKWGQKVELFIQEKIRLLETDFNGYPLKGEYLRSVTEGFDDLERIMRTHQTMLDIAKAADMSTIVLHMKQYYTNFLVPLLNIMSKLENDYIAIVTKTIHEKSKMLSAIQQQLKILMAEKQEIRKRIFYFNKRKRFIEISKNIQYLEFRQKVLQLTLQHDKLNLYYFTHEKPVELKMIKDKSDRLRKEILNTKEYYHAA